MNIAKNSVVTFHYRLSDADGAEIETSRDGEPTLYLHGHRNILPALEDAFSGRTVGDTFSVTLSPDQAYGRRREGASQRVPIKHLAGRAKPRPGTLVGINTEQGVRQVTVLKVGKFNVDVDTNHPLAGKTLTFDIEVVAVRQAESDEIAHGHAHGVGGHQH